MPIREERRRRARHHLDHYGLELKPVMFDSRGGSLGIGRRGEDGYNSPTFAQEDDALLWILQSPEAVQRIQKGEPFLMTLALVERMEEAAKTHAAGPGFLESLDPDLYAARNEAERLGDEELAGLIDDIAAMVDKAPSEVIAFAREAFGLPDFEAAPKP